MNMPKFQDAHLGPGRETKTASAFRSVLGNDWNLSDRTQNRDEESGEKQRQAPIMQRQARNSIRVQLGIHLILSEAKRCPGIKQDPLGELA